MTDILTQNFLTVEGLRWLPWIGNNFLTTPNEQKLLLVGESHYYKPEEKGSLEKHQDNLYTRIVVEKVAIEKEYKQYEKRTAKIFPNIHFTFLGSDNIDSGLFWNKVAYYNFIQRPMKTNHVRPTKKDNMDAWQIFGEVINILNPATCIFLEAVI